MLNFNLSAIAVRERAVTLFFILLMAAAGAYAFLMLGRAEDPSFTIKTLTVTTVWPGATAREMQDQVAEPLEKRLQELTWYDRVETTTRPGYAYMTVTLKDSTPPSSVQEEFYQARKKLGDEARKLPSGVLGPFVNDEYSDVSFALYALRGRACRCGNSPGKPKLFARTCCTCPASRRSTSSANVPNRYSSSFPTPNRQPSACRHRISLLPCSGRTPSHRQARSTPRGRRFSSGSTALMTASRRSPTRPSSLRGGR